jgi:hypothetical protein
MKLINFDGMSFFGPGSEWFWGMAQFILVAATLFGLYRQLRAMGAANAFARIETLQGAWASRTMTHARVTAALELRYAATPRYHAAMRHVADFMNDVWEFHERGFLSAGEVTSNWGLAGAIWWELIRPVIERQRKLDGSPTLDEGFQKLAALVVARMASKEHYVIGPFDEPTRLKWLDEAINRNTEALEMLTEIESGHIPTRPGASKGSRRGTGRPPANFEAD